MMPPIDPNSKQMVDALSALTQQLSKLNAYFDQQQSRQTQAQVMGHEERTAQALTPKVYQDPSLGNARSAYRAAREGGLERNDQGVFINAPGLGRTAAIKEALQQFAPQRTLPSQDQTPGSVGPSASTPDAVGGRPMGQYSSGRGGLNKYGDKYGDHQSILDLGIMGQYTGSAGKAISTMALESIGLRKAMQAATNQTSPDSFIGGVAANGIPQGVPFLGGKSIKGLNSANLQAVSGALNLAANNPMATYAAYKSIQGLGHVIGATSANLKDFQTLGETFGNGPPSIGGQNIFGFHNPFGYFGTAAQVGGSIDVERQALMGRIPGYGFGSGMNSEQATQAVQGIAGQGFSNQPMSPILSTIAALPKVGSPLAGILSGIFGGGPQGDLSTIAQNFSKPLTNRYGTGLNIGSTEEEFLPALRNSGTSIRQLTDTLANLSQESKGAKETVDQMRDSIFNAGQAFQNMGASAGGSYGLAKGFTDITAMDPQIAAQIAQNPMFQGMALGKYGVLPSAIGDMNPGAFSQNMTQTVQMYAQGLRGLDVNKYQTINGRKVLISNGQTAMEDQIHQMTGLPTSIVNRILGDAKGNQARSTLGTSLGAAGGLDGTGTGFWNLLNQGRGQHHKLNAKQYADAQDAWNKTIAPFWRDTGISQGEMKKISGMHDMRARATALSDALSKASGNDKINQIQNNPNTFTINLSNQAARLFNISGGPSGNKKAANAGGSSISGVINSPAGDISNTSMMSGLGDTNAGGVSGVATIMSGSGTGHG